MTDTSGLAEALVGDDDRRVYRLGVVESVNVGPPRTLTIGGRAMRYFLRASVGDSVVWIDEGADPVVIGKLSDGDDGIPIGGIIMWSQSPIPAGWLRCDGSSTAGTALASLLSNTPDLRDRFIVGAGGAHPLRSTGGASTVSLSSSQIPGHSHSQPSHNHPPGGHVHGPIGGGEHITTSGTGTLYGVANGSWFNFRGQGNTAGPSASGFTGAAGGESTGSVGGGGSHENKPPYYAMIYLIRAD